MIEEACSADLLINKAKEAEILYDSLKKGFSIPDISCKMHNSLTIVPWWPLEFVPKWRIRGFPFYFPLGRRRRMFEDPFGKELVPTIHRSVLYRNIPADYQSRTFGNNTNYTVALSKWKP